MTMRLSSKMTTYRSENIVQRLTHIAERMDLLKAQRTVLLLQLPDLIKKRDWADTHASAQTWYHANVAVNQAEREVKRIEKELYELEYDRFKLDERLKKLNELN